MRTRVRTRFFLITQSLTHLITKGMTLVLLFPLAADACPGCKEALFDPGQLQQKLSTARGYALSIGLLLFVPLTLIGTIAALVVRATRRQ